MKQVAMISVLGAGLIGITGCGMLGTGVRVAKNMSHTDNVSVYVDGTAAKRDQFKQAATGYSRYNVSGQVSTSPSVRFEIGDPDKMGRVTSVIINIYQKFEADYSHQADFTIVANSNDPAAQMRPGQTYNLGALPAGFRVLDISGSTVSGVSLDPGKQYLMNLTIRADKSETAQVYFETN
ncbi:MAG: hypothetical protein KDA32_00575 [Phycisphaerales bacterium]|nr:hypothetical protein [Phycisphaerales bacterium]